MARIRIADMEIGSTYTVPLAVVNSSSRTTRAGKPYLVIDVYDGQDTITANYWDWNGQKAPARNTVYDFKVECGEYMGKRQLTIRSVALNVTDMLEDFMPQGDHDVSHVYKDFYALMGDVDDDFYRSVGLHITDAVSQLLVHQPGAKQVHHAYMGGTLVHSHSVGLMARQLAMVTPGAWVALATVGGLLHDIGKLFTYNLEGLAIDITDDGQLLDHVVMGAEFVGNQAMEFVQSDMDELKLQMLRHVILSHHGKKDWGSPVTPRCIEAYIVAHCDMVDAAAEQIRTASRGLDKQRWTDKIWALDNMPHFTPQAMEALSTKPFMTLSDIMLSNQDNWD